MNKFLKIFSVLLLGVWLVGMYRAKFGQDTLTQASPDVLILGTDGQHQPYAFFEQGQVVGFDVDLFSTLATRIGKKRIIKKLSPDQLMSQLSDDMVHAIAQKTETKEVLGEQTEADRQPAFDETLFLTSRPYLEQNLDEDEYQNDPRHTQHFFVVSKNNQALLILLNNALDEIKEDGTLVALQKKWNLIA